MFEAVVFICSIYNVNFRNLVEAHEPGIGKYINGKMDFVLVNPPYNVEIIGMQTIWSMIYSA